MVMKNKRNTLLNITNAQRHGYAEAKGEDTADAIRQFQFDSVCQPRGGSS